MNGASLTAAPRKVWIIYIQNDRTLYTIKCLKEMFPKRNWVNLGEVD